jgi:hypothetical protein
MYYVGDDSQGGVETSMHWDCDYRFDLEMRKIGNITAVDMSKLGSDLITGTSNGYVCVWDSLEKVPIKRFKNEYKGLCEPIDKIFCPFDKTQIFCYNSKSLNLNLFY